jgi:hypothetical protein
MSDTSEDSPLLRIGGHRFYCNCDIWCFFVVFTIIFAITSWLHIIFYHKNEIQLIIYDWQNISSTCDFNTLNIKITQ